MKLSFLGNSYQSTICNCDVIDLDSESRFLGQYSMIKRSFLPRSSKPRGLIYRGVTY